MGSGLVVLWLLVLVEGMAIVILMREIGRLHLRLGPVLGARATADGPAVGAPAPQFTVEDGEARAWALGGPAPRPRLLLFVSERCSACRRLLPSVVPFARSQPEVDVLVSLHAEAGSPYETAVRPLPILRDQSLPVVFGVRRFPYALMIGADGIVRGKGIVNTLDHLESLVA